MVYLPSTKTLFNFKLKCMRILRPLTLDYLNDGLAMFNILCQDWTYEIITERGDVYLDHMYTPWCTELKIKIADSRDEGEDSGCSS